MIYLEAQHITKRYGEHIALDDVCLQAAKGSVHGLLGPNGAGKSSLIRIINIIIAPDSGSVFLGGKPLTAQDTSKIGYLPEERGLYKRMRVGEHLLFLAQLRDMTKKEAQAGLDYWLTKFDIQSWKNKKVEELSKGMQQKVQFIAAVIHNPDLLIFDEPFSGLDPLNAQLLRSTMLELKAQGKTILLSTHTMESVEALCDQITLIDKSKVILQGDVKDIRSRFRQHVFNVEIEGQRFETILNDYTVLSTIQEGDRIRLRLKSHAHQSGSELIRLLSDNYSIVSFTEELPTMNDIFIQLVSLPTS